VQGVDTLAVSTIYAMCDIETHLGGFLDLTTDRLWDELLDELLELGALGLSSHDLDHLGSDLSNLGRFGVGSLLDLVESTLGEANSEETEDVAIGGSDVDRGLDQSLPFTDNRSELVGGEVHAEERGKAVLAGDVLDPQLDLSERLLLVVVEVGEGELDDTALKRVVGVSCRVSR